MFAQIVRQTGPEFKQKYSFEGVVFRMEGAFEFEGFVAVYFACEHVQLQKYIEYVHQYTKDIIYSHTSIMLAIWLLLVIVATSLAKQQQWWERNIDLIQWSSDNMKDWPAFKNELNSKKQLNFAKTQLQQSQWLKVLSQQFPNLKQLSFCNKDPSQYNFISQTIYKKIFVLTPKVLETIFTSQYFPRLKSFNLQQTNIDDRYLTFLKKDHSITTSIQNLSLGYNFISTQGFKALATIEWKQIKGLLLTHSLLIDFQAVGYVLKIICGKQWKHGQKCQNWLQILNLDSTNIKRDGFIELMSTINTNSLRQLNLDHLSVIYKTTLKEGFDYSAFEVMSKLSFPQLQVLSLKDAAFDDHSAQVFQNSSFPKLRTLDLSKTSISDLSAVKWITKKNMPNLKKLLVQDSLISDVFIAHLKQQEFVFEQLDFMHSKASSKSYEILFQMNISQLQKLNFFQLHMNQQQVNKLIKGVQFPNLKQLKLQGLTRQTSGIALLKALWNIQSLQKVTIKNIPSLMQEIFNPQQFAKDDMDKKQFKRMNLKQLVFEQCRFETLITNSLLVLVPKLFPNLEYLKIDQKQQLIIASSMLSALKFKQGFVIDINLFTMFYRNGKFQVISSFLPFILPLFIKENPTQNIQVGDDMIKDMNKKISFKNIVSMIIGTYLDITAFLKISKLNKQTVYSQINLLVIVLNLDWQYFYSTFSRFKFPNLQKLTLNIQVSPQYTLSQIKQQLIPYLQQFTKLQFFAVQITILDDENSVQQKKYILDSLYYPQLIFLGLAQQNAQVKEIEGLVSKHNQTLRSLLAGSNFLQRGFFDMLVQSQIVLNYFDISSISFSKQQFSKFGKMNTQFIIQLKLTSNDLRNQHVLEMLQNRTRKSILTKLQRLDLSSNDLRGQALEALLSTGMDQLTSLIVQRNNNPTFLNTFLNYPTRITDLLAVDLDLYNIEKDLHVESARLIELILLKLQSFTPQDFHGLGRLNFARVKQATIQIANIYDCQVLKDLLNILKRAELVNLVFINDFEGLNSTCFKDQSFISNIKGLEIKDMYGTTYIPQFVQLLLNTTKHIQGISLQLMRLPPRVFQKIGNLKLSGAQIMRWQGNYVDKQGLRKYLSGLTTQTLINFDNIGLAPQDLEEAFAESNKQFIIALKISHNQLTEDTVANILQKQSLRVLAMKGCNLGSRALDLILKAKLITLYQLQISYNDFNEQDIVNFVAQLESTRMPRLGKIYFKGISISKQNYDKVNKILTTKNIQCELEDPYYIKSRNSAQI